jgi:hypothetical protein
MFIEKIGVIRSLSGIRVRFFRFCGDLAWPLEAKQGLQNEL